MNQPYNVVSVIKIILKWKWLIIGATILSVAVAAIVSVFFMDEYFKSRAIINPINQGMTDRSALFSEKGESQVEYYGTKNDVNRILEIANSSSITDFLINYYHLADHYKLNSSSKYWRTKVKKRFLKNYSVIKTEHEAVEISIMDTDPQLASDMVNMVVEKIDEKNKEPVIRNKQRIVARFQEDVKAKKVELDTLTAAMNIIGKAYNIQVKSDEKGNESVIGPTAEGVELYKVAQQRQHSVLEEYNKLSVLKDQFEISAKENVPSVNIIEQAWPAEKREKPERSLICVTTGLITFFLSIIAALLIEQVKLIRLELKNDAQ